MSIHLRHTSRFAKCRRRLWELDADSVLIRALIALSLCFCMGVECGGCSPCSTIACQLFRQCAFILTPASTAWNVPRRTTPLAFCLLGQRLKSIWALTRSISPPQTDLLSLLIRAEAEKRPAISIVLIYASLLVSNWCLENSVCEWVRAAATRKSGHDHIVGFNYERISFQHASSAVGIKQHELPLYPFKITQSCEMLNTSGRYCYCETIIHRRIVHMNIITNCVCLCLCNRLLFLISRKQVVVCREYNYCHLQNA